ncbi:hypothetical protein T01_12860 [Trichinella spiralis]|uniref:Uncharacterized protein n=1 Tax=Trichinella spiralis TaxID=6334 RepID=A0A0V1BA86_TRISP|nr:hypothetical protein T01_12860 [Trichinella spiralis]
MAADDKPPFMDMDNDNLGQSLRFVDILDLRLDTHDRHGILCTRNAERQRDFRLDVHLLP